ncbi:methyltransferase domain-containing protein [Geobacter pelophilus]|uniref:Methyltransferase domain-containing protein n=1 Tax=Geoanaerobacter pelophilus TaxID=60036 RepID=A0AAW4L5J6_9BACT|nr:class I SAM-dependent methyltransferase [Geoanaerobacter pelophilus]MBT0663486.1 methyltransferase domain-containing protein [Geoanaerobacter pelophilus]
MSPIHAPDLFSDQAAAYHEFRPVYPPALTAFFASRSPGRSLAWDCGCGSGQFSAGLAGWFDRVVATDLSFQQIRQAPINPKIAYLASLSEQAPLADGCADLIVAAQALHWFNLDLFYSEVRRVAKPGGMVAAVSYGLLEVSPGVDRLIRKLHSDIVGQFWPPERRHVDTGYAELEFPFEQLEPPRLTMKEHWTLKRLTGYLGTWSAVRRYIAANGCDPLELIAKELEAAWGDPHVRRTVKWPLTVKAGRVE